MVWSLDGREKLNEMEGGFEENAFVPYWTIVWKNVTGAGGQVQHVIAPTNKVKLQKANRWMCLKMGYPQIHWLITFLPIQMTIHGDKCGGGTYTKFSVGPRTRMCDQPELGVETAGLLVRSEPNLRGQFCRCSWSDFSEWGFIHIWSGRAGKQLPCINPWF